MHVSPDKIKSEIKVIFFDLFGVLLGVDQSVAIHHISKVTETPYLQTREIAQGEIFMELQRGEINFSTYVEKLREAIPNGNRLDTDGLHQVWMNSKAGEMPVVSLLDGLQQKYAIWIISNTTEAHIKNLQAQFEFLSSFNGIITSEKAGTHKPHPNIFNFALKEANTDAFSSIFIDDSYSNVEVAKNLDIVSHHYIEFDGLVNFLEKICKFD
ncbi:MAG: HAD-IA family hydrolase [Candidatus Marinimicrobia bacterium]|nr:HAD-IA family hydrolase [Candidatus Neomarinimicrobiota bacterium]